MAERNGGNVASLPGAAGLREHLRVVEAVIFASAEPVEEAVLAALLPSGADLTRLLGELQSAYAGRGVNLVRVAGGWAFRTAEDLALLLRREQTEPRKLSRAALETLAIIAYHQPATRAKIEEIRGVAAAKGTLDVLLESGWVRMRGRRKSPGRPITYGTTPAFLDHFGLERIGDLPGLEELRGAGLLDSMPEAALAAPRDEPDLFDDEEPLGALGDDETGGGTDEGAR
jgi:segregation and condensation protein B